jgi:hypothetical protein
MFDYQEERRSRAEILDLANILTRYGMLPFEEKAGWVVSYAFRPRRVGQDARQGQLEESPWIYAEGELQCIGIHNII